MTRGQAIVSASIIGVVVALALIAGPRLLVGPSTTSTSFASVPVCATPTVLYATTDGSLTWTTCGPPGQQIGDIHYDETVLTPFHLVVTPHPGFAFCADRGDDVSQTDARAWACQAPDAQGTPVDIPGDWYINLNGNRFYKLAVTPTPTP